MTREDAVPRQLATRRKQAGSESIRQPALIVLVGFYGTGGKIARDADGHLTYRRQVVAQGCRCLSHRAE